MQLFYSPHITSGTFQLEETESKHLVRVLRKKMGDTVHFTNGKGFLFTCRIVDDHPKKCILEITEQQELASPLARNVHLVIAPTKNNDRIEWCVEKITEIGVQRITPIITENSERKKFKTDRIKRVAISAMKQSNQFHLPVIDEPISFDGLIKEQSWAISSSLLIAHCEEQEKRDLVDLEVNQNVVLLIGPEGDFSPSEIQLAIEAGFQPVSLGSTRLRTETAGIVGVTLLQNA